MNESKSSIRDVWKQKDLSKFIKIILKQFPVIAYKCSYWSRRNGWVIAALAKVLTIIPENAPHRKQYVSDLKAMAKALALVKREDGFWNVSLHDKNNFGEK